MAVLTVGSGQQFATVKAAVAASHDGDTLYVQAGTYLDDFSVINTKISIIGVGGMVHFVADEAIPNGKAFLVTNTDVTLDHLEFSGAHVSDDNGSGVRYQGGNLTITNSYFHDNQEGLLAGGEHPGGAINIQSSEFSHNGMSNGLSHNIYVGEVDNFTISGSYLHDAEVGNELKSRAATTVVVNNRIADDNSTASYSIDLPNNGDATIKNNIIQQGPNTENPAIIEYGAGINKGFALWPDSSLSIEGNTIINQLDKVSALGLKNYSSITANIADNAIYGLSDTRIASGANVQSGDTVLSTAPTIDTSHPWDKSAWDSLVSGNGTNDVLSGTPGNDLLVGGSGSDTFVIAGGGSDTITAFNSPGGHDVVQLAGYGFSSFAAVQAAMVQNGADTVLNLGHGDTLTFQDAQIGDFAAGDFLLSGSVYVPPAAFILPTSDAPVDVIQGNGGANTLIGTAKDDRLSGGGAADKMVGGAGDDTYGVGSANDVVVENASAGIDTVRSTASSYTLAANVENLVLSGNTSHVGNGNALGNLITASNADDTINGGGGNDIIEAGSGADVLTGGTGDDMFVFSDIGAESHITDFHIGEDLLDLRPLMSAAHYAGSDPVADHAIHLASDGHGGSIVAVDPALTGTLHALVDLQGVAPTTVHMGLDLLWH